MIPMRYALSPGKTLVVRGPASISLLNGQASILGGTVQKNQRAITKTERQLPVETETYAELDIALGNGAAIFDVKGSTIPESWKLAADALQEMKEGKVMVIGATDVGKSTLCVYLVNRLTHHGLSPRLIDADIGQADLGPPTTIGIAHSTPSITSLTELIPDSLLFIGHTSPGQVERKIIAGIQRLTTHEREPLTIINTDGWVLDPAAILYKTDLIAAINPDLVLGLAKETELLPILARSRARTMNVEAATDVLSRSKTDRRKIRTAGYRRYLEGARPRSISLRETQFSIPKGFPSPETPRGRELNNLIVGLLDENGYLLQIGVLMHTEPRALRVYSRAAEKVRSVEVGYVRLSINGKELGFLDL
jgi:polynucleotide 5'-hydroxyl-kinase GRC3/NOL9